MSQFKLETAPSCPPYVLLYIPICLNLNQTQSLTDSTSLSSLHSNMSQFKRCVNNYKIAGRITLHSNMSQFKLRSGSGTGRRIILYIPICLNLNPTDRQSVFMRLNLYIPICLNLNYASLPHAWKYPLSLHSNMSQFKHIIPANIPSPDASFTFQYVSI